MDFWGRKPEDDFIRAFEEVTEGHENNHEAQLSTERMEELYEGLKDRKNLSIREKQFLERYEKSALTESEDAEEEEEKRCAG